MRKFFRMLLLALVLLTVALVSALTAMRFAIHGREVTIPKLVGMTPLEASRNAALLSTYANFAGRIRRVRYSANFARKRDRWGEAMREHEAILDALRRRAGNELCDLLFKHLRNKRTAAVEHLKEGATTASAPA